MGYQKIALDKKVHLSYTSSMNNTLTATVLDPMSNEKSVRQIDRIVACKSGLLGKIVGTNFNVYRPWTARSVNGQTIWMTNLTSSTRFNLETDGMTPAEIAAFTKGA